MSAIYGGAFLRAETEGNHRLKAIGLALMHYGPDGNYQYQDNELFLGLNTIFISGDEVNEKYPFSIPGDDSLKIVADVKLDLRDELLNRLGFNTQVESEYSDPQLILLAYRKWGASTFAQYLFGSFAFALWDQKNKELILGRDQMGSRSLYYTRKDGELYFCSRAKDLAGLRKWAENDACFIAHRLALSPTNRSLYRDVFTVEEGEFICFTSVNTKRNRYHEFKIINTPHYSRKEDYVSHARELLIKIVKGQAKSKYPISAALSGGLDSTGICYLLKDLLPQGQKKLLTYTCYPNDNGNEDLDFVLQNLNEKWLTNTSVKINFEESFANFVKGIKSLGEPLLTFNLVQLIPAFIHAQKSKSKLFFSGSGGELACSNYGYEELFYLLKRGNFSMLKYAMQNEPTTSYFQPFNPYRAYASFVKKKILNKQLFSFFDKVDYSGIYKYKEVFVDSRWERFRMSRLVGQEKMISHINYSKRIHNYIPTRNFIFELCPMEICNPLESTLFLEFMINIPMEIRLINFKPRGMAKELFSGLVPNVVLRRKDKSYFSWHSRAFHDVLSKPNENIWLPNFLKHKTVANEFYIYFNTLNFCNDEKIFST